MRRRGKMTRDRGGATDEGGNSWKLDEEKKEISRKRQEERKIMSRKRSRSKSEEADKPRRKEKAAAVGDLRARLDMKKSPEKKVKKRESSSTSSSSSSSDSESEQDVVQKIFEDKKLLKKMLQLASASKKKNKKKGKKKKKSSKDKIDNEKPLHRRVMLSGKDQLTMQLSTSQEERSPSPVNKKKSKKSRADVEVVDRMRHQYHQANPIPYHSIGIFYTRSEAIRGPGRPMDMAAACYAKPKREMIQKNKNLCRLSY